MTLNRRIYNLQRIHINMRVKLPCSTSWTNPRLPRYKKETKEIFYECPITIESFVTIIHENLYQNTRKGWFPDLNVCPTDG